MDSLKPAPLFPQRTRQRCPICGLPSYSREGVHPQCALQKADEPRNRRLRALRASTPKADKLRKRAWNKKCPKCAKELHVRRAACDCGHVFFPTS